MSRWSDIPPPVRSLAAFGHHHRLFLGMDTFPRVKASSRANGYDNTRSRQRYRRTQDTFNGCYRSRRCSLRCLSGEKIACNVLCLFQSAFVLCVVFIGGPVEKFCEEKCSNGILSGLSSVCYRRYRRGSHTAVVSRVSRENRVLLDVLCRFWRFVAAFWMARG
jgi:hypothetical protein